VRRWILDARCYISRASGAGMERASGASIASSGLGVPFRGLLILEEIFK